MGTGKSKGGVNIKLLAQQCQVQLFIEEGKYAPINPTPKSFKELLNWVASYRPMEGLALYYISPQNNHVPIKTAEDYIQGLLISNPKLDIYVETLEQSARNSPYDDTVPVQGLQLDEGIPAIEAEPPVLNANHTKAKVSFTAGDQYLFRIFEGFLKVVNVKTHESSRFSHKLLDIDSRGVFLANGELVITGGFKMPNLVLKVNLARGKAEELPVLLTKRHSHATVLFEDSVYVLGGQNKTEKTNECEFLLEDTWKPISSLNIERCGHSATVNSGSIFVCGGVDQDSFEQYQDGTWTLLEIRLETPICNHGFAFYSNKGCFILGGSNYKTSVDIFSVEISSKELNFAGKLPKPEAFKSEIIILSESIYMLGFSEFYIWEYRRNSWNEISF